MRAMTNRTAPPQSATPFPLENKSAEQIADETKDLTAGEDKDDTDAPDTDPEPVAVAEDNQVEVELIHHINLPDGKGGEKSHVPGATVTVSRQRAAALVGGKFAVSATATKA